MSSKNARVLIIILIGCLCFLGQAFGQTDSLALASASTTVGGRASLKLSLTSAVGSDPAGIQWAVNYTSSDIVAITATVGPAALTAGKSISCNGSTGSYLCLLTGINSNTISNGIAAVINITLSPTVTTSTSISIKNPIGASAGGAVISMTATGGTVTIVNGPPLGVSGLTCTPTALNTPATSTCTVTLNRPATSATTVSLADNNTSLSIPASASVAAGSSSANFTARSGLVSVTQTATLTATLGASSQTTHLVLQPAQSVSSVQCNPTSLVFGGRSSCTATINRVALQAIQLPVSTNNSSGLHVPSAVTVEANASSVKFSVTAGNVVGQFTVIVGLIKRAVISVTGAQKTNQPETSISSLETDKTGVKPDALSCLPKAVKAGDRITCQAHLGPTPVSGVLSLKVFSSSGDVQVPASITTRSMQSTVSFEGYSNPGSTERSVVVQVGLGAHTVQDAVTIQPSPSPVLTVPGKQIARAGNSVSFTVSALDANGGVVAMSVSKLPLGASFDTRSGNFSWTPSSAQSGSYDVAFTAVNPMHLSSTASVAIEVGSGKPVVTALVNGATQSAESSCSPGAIASVLGRWLTQDDATRSDPAGSSNQLGGTTVKVNGEYARLLYVSGTRVDFICPQLPSGTALQVSTEDGSGSAVAVDAVMRDATPGIFTVDGSGQGQGMILFPGSATVAMAMNPWISGEPAQPGDNIAIRVTGVRPDAGISVKLGNVIALPQSIRAVDNNRGMFDVLLTLPPGVATSDAVPVSIQLAQPSGEVVESNVVTMAIEEIRP